MRLIPTNSQPVKDIFGELDYISIPRENTTATAAIPTIYNMNNDIKVSTLNTPIGLNTFVKYDKKYYYGSDIETVKTFSVSKKGSESYINDTDIELTVIITSKATWSSAYTYVYIDKTLMEKFGGSSTTYVRTFLLPSGSTLNISNTDNISSSVKITGKVIWTEITDNVDQSIAYSVPSGNQSTIYFNKLINFKNEVIEQFDFSILKYRGSGNIQFGFSKDFTNDSYEMNICKTITDSGTYTIIIPEEISLDNYYLCINITDMDVIFSSLTCNKPYKQKMSENNWIYLFSQYVTRYNEEI